MTLIARKAILGKYREPVAAKVNISSFHFEFLNRNDFPQGFSKTLVSRFRSA